MGVFDPHIIHGYGSLGTRESTRPHRISIGSAVFWNAHKRGQQTDPQTDHATPTVAI